MSTSSTIKALLAMTNTKQGDLINYLDVSSKQALSNKFSRDGWNPYDLVGIADATGCKVGFLLPDGQFLRLTGKKE